MGALKIFGFLCLAYATWGQQAQPECKRVTFWGVTGCETASQQKCAKGYHKQLACPANPMIKAPCHWLCVADAPKTDGNQKKIDATPRP
jgi:hypothetical protein